MRAGSLYKEQIDAALMATYAAATEPSNFTMLALNLSKWDEETYPEKSTDEVKIAEELYKLMTFLDKKGLKHQSDEVFRMMLLTFPERHFAQSPGQIIIENVDFELFKTEKSETMTRFEDCFRMAIADSERFIHDIELNMFREDSIGLAGNLFTTFVAAAVRATGSARHDVPWKLMHQLCWLLNNTYKAYNQAYGIVRCILSAGIVAPTPAFKVELEHSMNFFKRNYYWSSIDKATMTGDHASLVMYIDRLMPMVSAGHEKSNLIMLRAKAVKKAKGLPWSCLLIVLALTTVIPAANYFLGSYFTRFSSPTDTESTSTTPTRLLEPKQTSSYVPAPDAASTSLRVLNRAGLDESIPPPQPLGRKLTLAELRYVVFQKHRLEHLEGIDLSEEEQEALHRLWQEWRSRGENIEAASEDKKSVENEAEIYSELIKGDATDQLKLIVKSLEADDWTKENHENTNASASENNESRNQRMQQVAGLLNLNDPADIKKVLLQLEKTGYYNGPTDLISWNSVARSALARFKAAKMLRTDDRWDLATQQALFPDTRPDK
ncbi:MAG: hypothetical protein CVV41_02540 [Candidatus Riflebacteria bacterium HGW-Riflebacteria-1]|jgi:hypothetical protein|nr:MAG: hypothetical protein CVV41_02540 [Candidatus Riflebacteria bacterium HGW-Riflebacteria-1]